MCSSEDFDMKSDCSSGVESSHEQYIVEKIVGKKLIKGEVYYRIKWKDYPDEENTWEPERNCVDALSLIQKFEKKERQKRSRSVGTIAEGKILKNSDREATGRRKTDVSEASRRFNNLTIASENMTKKGTKTKPEEEFFPSESDYKAGKKVQRKTALSCDSEKPKVMAARRRQKLNSDNENQSGTKVYRRDSFNDFDTTSTNQINVECAENSDLMDCTTMSTCNLKGRSMLQKYPASEIEILGAIPTDNGVIIGVKVKNSEEIIQLNSKEVTDLWPKLYISFLERHIIFEEK